MQPDVVADLQHLSEVISQATAPAFLLGAVSGLLGLLMARFSRVLDRIRAVAGIAADDQSQAHLRSELPRLMRQMRILKPGDLLRGLQRDLHHGAGDSGVRERPARVPSRAGSGLDLHARARPDGRVTVQLRAGGMVQPRRARAVPLTRAAAPAWRIMERPEQGETFPPPVHAWLAGRGVGRRRVCGVLRGSLAGRRCARLVGPRRSLAQGHGSGGATSQSTISAAPRLRKRSRARAASRRTPVTRGSRRPLSRTDGRRSVLARSATALWPPNQPCCVCIARLPRTGVDCDRPSGAAGPRARPRGLIDVWCPRIPGDRPEANGRPWGYLVREPGDEGIG